MKPAKRLYFAAAAAMGIDWLKKRSPIDILIPFYHLVSDEPVPYIGRLYAFKNTRQFEDDLDFLLKHFRPVSLQQVMEQMKKQEPFSQKSFLITFDDGLKQVAEVVSPILQRKGVPAALFINPAFIDNKEIFYDLKKGLILEKLAQVRIDTGQLKKFEEIFNEKFSSPAKIIIAVKNIDYLNKQLTESIGHLLEVDFETFRLQHRPFMSTGQVNELINKGFDIGAHSMDHPLYSLIPLKEQLRQTVESVNWVRNTFRIPYKAFAFPHVDAGVTHTFFNELVDHDKPALDLVFGNDSGMMESHPLVLHRFIGENPAIPMRNMSKAILTYGIIRKSLGRQYVKRGGIEG